MNLHMNRHGSNPAKAHWSRWYWASGDCLCAMWWGCLSLLCTPPCKNTLSVNDDMLLIGNNSLKSYINRVTSFIWLKIKWTQYANEIPPKSQTCNFVCTKFNVKTCQAVITSMWLKPFTNNNYLYLRWCLSCTSRSTQERQIICLQTNWPASFPQIIPRWSRKCRPLIWCCTSVFDSSHGVSWEAAESGGEGGAERSQGNSSAGEFQLEHHHPQGQQQMQTHTQ